MSYSLIYYNHPTLRKHAKKVDPIGAEIKKIADLMDEVCLKNNGGGLAAPQVDLALRFFLVHFHLANERGYYDIEKEYRLFINPVLSEPSLEKEVMEEGCLSIPGIYLPIVRPKAITVTWQDIEGKTHEQRFSGLDARQLMHENDHLNGVLIIDRVDKKVRKKMDPILSQIHKKYYPR